MVQRVGGSRRKSRNKLKKNISDKGKISIRRFLAKFEKGDRVLLKAEPAVQDGLYHMRFHKKTGIVQKNQGNCYIVKIKDSNKEKCLIVHPVHLQRI